MQIRATANFITEHRSWERGDTGNVSPDEATRLIAAGLAEEPGAPETAKVEAPENAMKPRARARRSPTTAKE